MYSLFLKDSLPNHTTSLRRNSIYIKEKELETYAPPCFIFFTFRAVKMLSH